MRLLSAIVVFTSMGAFAQTGPGGVGATDGTSTLNTWWRADEFNATADGTLISTWTNQSGVANRNLTSAGGNRPTVQTSAALNGLKVVRYTAANSNYFSSAFSGPAVNAMTVFFVANGTSYQSLIRYQNAGGTFVVYPWENGGGRTFISSSDGGTAGGIASGLVNSVNNVGGAGYTRNTVNGMQTFLNGGINAQRNSVNNALPSQPFFSGRYNPGASEYPNCDVGEMMIYLTSINIAQTVIVQNYLAAKFNVTLTSNDVYTQDDVANGNYDFDVAGIGRFSSPNQHTDAQGTGFVRILNATDLENGEYFMWGHDNGTAQATNTADIPAGVTARFARVWRVSETGGDSDVGNIDLHFDVTGLPDFTSLSVCDAAGAIKLLVDTDNDGTFADQTPIGGATNIGGNVYRFANVSTIANGNRFTLAITASSIGPAGVGNSSLNVLWLSADNNSAYSDAGTTLAVNGNNVQQWNDRSGNAKNASHGTVGEQPNYQTAVLNGLPVIRYTAGNNDRLLSTAVTTGNAASVWVVASYTSLPSTNPGLIHGAPSGLAFSGTGNNKSVGMWVNSATTRSWGRGVQSDNTVRDITQVTALSAATPYIILNRYDGAASINQFLNNAASGSVTYNGTLKSWTDFGIGRQGNESWNGDIAEVIAYISALNTAQRILIDNYLAAKYGVSLTSNDIYTRDTPGNGNFDFEVAGIGRVDATNIHSDARGSGMVRISNPTGLGDGEFFVWGHDNGTLASTNTTDVPAGIQGRLERVWAVSETGEVGNVDVLFDLTGQGSVTASDLMLLIDNDNDGVFNEAGTVQVAGATALSCNTYIFNGVSAVNDAMRFTIGTINVTQTPLPVELVSFNASIVNEGVQLKWTTASELCSDYFTIQRSEDGEQFGDIVDVKGAGTSTEIRNYSALDSYPPFGQIFYRLKQKDFDGRYSYSDIISVENVSHVTRLLVSPNPLKSGQEINLKIFHYESLNTEIVNCSLIDLLGRSVPITFDKDGANGLKVHVNENIAPGIYIIKIHSPEIRGQVFQRVVLER